MGVFQQIANQQNQAGGSAGGGLFSGLQPKAQIKAPIPAPTSNGLGTIRDLAQGAAKGATQGIIQGVSGLTALGGAAEAGLDQTLGRVGNIVAGKGNVPTTSSAGAFKTASDLSSAADLPVFQKKNTAESVGGYIGQAADALVAPPGGKIATKGAEIGGDLATKGAGKVGQIAENAMAARAASTAAKDSARVLDIVSPKLTTKETADALATRGGTKSGLLGTVKLNVDPAVRGIADAVSKYVPEFSPKNSLVENINATKGAVGKMASDLKAQVVASGKDIIYPFKELAAKMNAVEKPISLQADATLSRKFDLAQSAALKIAKDAGGKISDLLEARKSFDALVEKEFPTLYDRENAPMRSAITAMRRVMNDFIADKLPDVNFKESLRAQSSLLDAVGNMSEKAASEVGTNILQRGATFVKEHPAVSTGVGLFGANDILKRLTGFGL